MPNAGCLRPKQRGLAACDPLAGRAQLTCFGAWLGGREPLSCWSVIVAAFEP
jgi:hypothetical protein